MTLVTISERQSIPFRLIKLIKFVSQSQNDKTFAYRFCAVIKTSDESVMNYTQQTSRYWLRRSMGSGKGGRRALGAGSQSIFGGCENDLIVFARATRSIVLLFLSQCGWTAGWLGGCPTPASCLNG